MHVQLFTFELILVYHWSYTELHSEAEHLCSQRGKGRGYETNDGFTSCLMIIKKDFLWDS
jgi:hypothetical protein